MQQPFDIRHSADRGALAALLPQIDGVEYTLSANELVAKLSALADHIPDNVPLIYQSGMVNIFQNALSLVFLLELAHWIQTLSECPGFSDVTRTFGNPTQFFDSHFELRTAFFFHQRPSCTSLAFGVPYEVRGHRKRPEFTIVVAGQPTVVECKRIHFSLSKGVSRFAAETRVLDAALSAASFPDTHRLEIEFEGPAREHFPLVASRAATKAAEMAAAGGGSAQVGHLLMHVCRREDAFVIPIERRGLQQNTIVLPGGKAVQMIDPRYTRLRTFNGRYSNALRRLVMAAIADARTQLPEGLPGIVCIGDVPLRFSEETFGIGGSEILFPPHIAMVMLWDGDQLQAHFPESAAVLAQNLLPATT